MHNEETEETMDWRTKATLEIQDIRANECVDHKPQNPLLEKQENKL